jgi:hypothetical protein
MNRPPNGDHKLNLAARLGNRLGDVIEPTTGTGLEQSNGAGCISSTMKFYQIFWRERNV